MGLNFKLDIGTFRFRLQVACQRYRQNLIDAKSFSFSEFIASINPFVRNDLAYNAA